jgi:hypothetical protein
VEFNIDQIGSSLDTIKSSIRGKYASGHIKMTDKTQDMAGKEAKNAEIQAIGANAC